VENQSQLIESLVASFEAGLCPLDAEIFKCCIVAAERRIAAQGLGAEQAVLLVCKRQPLDFIASVFVGLRQGYSVFLGNIDWGEKEWAMLERQLGSFVVLCEAPQVITNRHSTGENHLASGLYIATGGSSGRLKFAHHTFGGLKAHVTAFCEFFKWDKVNCLCTLPLYHVSGWMQVMRSGMTGGSFKIVKTGDGISALDGLDTAVGDWCLSLVPTQLKRMLADPGAVDYLSRLRAVFLGGAAVPGELVQQALRLRIPIWLTYGMTETASMVAAVAGVHSKDSIPTARLFPHTQAKLEGDRLWLRCASQSKGYWPQGELITEQGWMRTDDRAELSADGGLRILGRVDDVIISGGEKIDPREVESVILAYSGVDDCFVYGVPDQEWGQRVCAKVSGFGGSNNSQGLQQHLKSQLSPYKIPKEIQWLTCLPRNKAGKLLRD
jgi:O-succinylbenzoic acid--CoA ligase